MSTGFANIANEDASLQLVSTQGQMPMQQLDPNSNSNSNFHNLPQTSNFQDLSNSNNKILPTFLSSFINQEFITDLINVLLYQSDFSSANSSIKSSDIVKFINTFITDVNKQIKRSPNSTFQLPKKVLLSATNLAREILQLRENITGKLINYDNVIRHFPKHEMVVGKILNDVVVNQITNHDDFRNKFEITIQSIQAFNEVIEISTTLVNWDAFVSEANRDDISSFGLLKSYRDLVSQSYNELAKLTTLSKQEELDEYIILHDQFTTKKVVDNLVQFLSSGYNFFKTGYKLLDDNVDGMESSTFHLITGPSNHAKSIFMINICRNLLVCNKQDYVKGDVIVYITLEDDLNKVLRRFISIFGNVDSKITKQLFIVASAMFKSVAESSDQSTVSNMIGKLLTDIINKAIISRLSNGNCKIIIKHSAENSFSPADATRFIDSLKLQGLNARALFVDYVDVMKPSSSRYSNYNDYDAQGMIVHELRKISQNYKIPVMSITQNTREAENMSQAMGNQLVGDSYKKIRFSDYIYMIRMRADLDLLSASVKHDIMDTDDDDDNDSQLSMTDMTGQYVQNLLAFEVQITKAKEGKKDVGKFHIFCGLNLNIYNSLAEFYADLPFIIKNNKELEDQISILNMQQRQQIEVQDTINAPTSLI